ncbi:hypothetical protein GCM10023195_87650 [Actinoallomurus liliacearum]|uniref:Uncharacterized protein n=1 Tax=Actinoallomurus liliacearum TaxID=1080073 RepID=A0ABP8U1J2_9ACTN
MRRATWGYASGAALMVISLTAATPASKSDRTDGTAMECRQIPVINTYYTNSAGRRTATPSADSSTTRVYNVYGGPMSVTVPPKTWNPVAASDAEIQRYGLYPRPKSPARRKIWEEMYSHVTSWAVPDMCARTSTRPLRSIRPRTRRPGRAPWPSR